MSMFCFRKGCPTCRQTFGGLLTLSKPVNCSIESLKFLYYEHRLCSFNLFPHIKEYMTDLNEVWTNFIRFIVETQVYKPNYIGIRGLEHLSLNKYEDEGRLLEKGPSYAIIKKKDGRTKVVMGCYLPCMSIRLVISPNDDSDIGQDNEYADEAVGYMNQQLEVCWRVFPKLLNSDIDHMLVRKFKNVTCYLLLTGLQKHSGYYGHFVPMKIQLENLKICNFNDSFFLGLRAVFPLCNRRKLSTPRKYKKFVCCKKADNYFSSESENEFEPEAMQDDDSDAWYSSEGEQDDDSDVRQSSEGEQDDDYDVRRWFSLEPDDDYDVQGWSEGEQDDDSDVRQSSEGEQDDDNNDFDGSEDYFNNYLQ